MYRLLFEQGKLNGMAGGLPSPGGAMQGFAEGGYTGDGPSNEVAGVVHKGEYVLTREELELIKANNYRSMSMHGRYLPEDLTAMGGRNAMGDLFHQAHDNLFPKGTPLSPGGGIYRPAGVPLDHLGPLRVNLPVTTPSDLSGIAAQGIRGWGVESGELVEPGETCRDGHGRWRGDRRVELAGRAGGDWEQ